MDCTNLSKKWNKLILFKLTGSGSQFSLVWAQTWYLYKNKINGSRAQVWGFNRDFKFKLNVFWSDFVVKIVRLYNYKGL